MKQVHLKINSFFVEKKKIASKNGAFYLMLNDDVPSSIPSPDKLPSKSAASASSMLSTCQ